MRRFAVQIILRTWQMVAKRAPHPAWEQQSASSSFSDDGQDGIPGLKQEACGGDDGGAGDGAGGAPGSMPPAISQVVISSVEDAASAVSALSIQLLRATEGLAAAASEAAAAKKATKTANKELSAAKAQLQQKQQSAAAAEQASEEQQRKLTAASSTQQTAGVLRAKTLTQFVGRLCQAPKNAPFRFKAPEPGSVEPLLEWASKTPRGAKPGQLAAMVASTKRSDGTHAVSAARWGCVCSTCVPACMHVMRPVPRPSFSSMPGPRTHTIDRACSMLHAAHLANTVMVPCTCRALSLWCASSRLTCSTLAASLSRAISPPASAPSCRLVGPRWWTTCGACGRAAAG